MKSLPNPTTALTDIVASFVPRVPRALARDRLGPMAFYTGQLGPGGAERQMSRLAVAMQDGFHTSGHIGGVRLLQPPKVCVRHIKQATNSDFFAAILTDNGVDLTVLNDVPLPDSRAVVDERQQGLMALLSVLPEDVMHSILKFAAYFRRNATDVAYIWQDGGVLIGAPAALIAGVPRIVTSFRGLPPNIRPENMRPQYPQFQRTLARVPGVTFSANCVATARAYEEWLDLDLGAVRVIPNAVPDTQPLGAPEDEALWAEVLRRSPDCTQTVLGVFRFDPNKRPELWIEVATRYLETHPEARFVMFGMGTEHAKCAMLVQDRGLADRIFICGVTRSVGYFMTRSDVVMHLARWEGLPNVVIEAQMAGVPVLATPAGGTDEIVDHGVTGFILSQADDPPVAEIVETLGRMLSDDALLKRMGAQAKVRAAARFTIDSVLRKTMSLFLEDRV